MCTARLLSQGSTSEFKFYLDRVVPIHDSWRQKTRGTALPDDGDRILLCSLVFTIPECDGRPGGYAETA